MKINAEIQRALLASEGSSEAIRRIYELKKASDKHFSMAYLCRRAGMASKGYLADVMAGKRTLSLKYRDSLVMSLKLPHLCRRYLKILIDRDHARDEFELAERSENLRALAKALRFESGVLGDEFRSRFFAFEVFAAFGLFENRPLESDLIHYFGRRQETQVREALNHLESAGLITREGDRSFLIQEKIIFDDSQGGFTHKDFLRMSFGDAAKSMELWFDRPEDSCFVSTIISVKQSEYREILQKFKSDLLQAQCEFESSDADQIVRFNVQVYPLR